MSKTRSTTFEHATQELHGANQIDAAAKRGGATKADLEALAQKAKVVTEFRQRLHQHPSAMPPQKASCGWRDPPRSDAEARRREFEELRQSFQTSVQKALADARASAQKISEAVLQSARLHPSKPQKARRV